MESPFRHSYVQLSTGIRMHIVEAVPPAGVVARGTVLCVHGWPDTWYGWRRQMRPLAHAGFHVIVPDQRGYGDTSAPGQTEAYTMEKVSSDNIALLDALGLEKVIFLGHDFGGTVVWAIALHHRERCVAVGSVCTPFYPADPKRNPWEAMKKPGAAGRFDYQMWHQSAEAEMELERDVERTITLAIRGSDPSDMVTPDDKALAKQPPTVKGGLFPGMPLKPPRSALLSEADLAVYVRQFKTSGFRGPLNWYRNIERNWEWSVKVAGSKVTQPSLMVTAGRDLILTAASARRIMPPLFKDNLVMEHVEEAGHWVLQEKPNEVNAILLRWLTSPAVADASLAVSSSGHAALAVPQPSRL